jgi:DNA/RNA-binding domain of Phe-tRNA-synthetase-like protein
MKEIKFGIEEAVTKAFPNVVVAAVAATTLRELPVDAIERRLAAEIARAADALTGYEPISDHPAIRIWRTAYAAMGVKPSKYRSSIEALLRRAQKRQDLATGIAFVDLYNAASLSTKTPIGGYDIQKLDASPILLRLARPGTDRFEPLGAKASDFPLQQGLIVYASGDEVLCWGFNGRDSNATCIGPKTTSAVFFSEAAENYRPNPVEALQELCRMAGEFDVQCGPIASVNAANGYATLQCPR